MLARSVWVMPIEVATVRYDDYRRVGTTMVPFRFIRQEGDTDPERMTVDRVEFTPQPAADEFAPPRTPDDSTVAGAAATVRITYDGDVVVEAMPNGKGLFGFILDTGGHDILTPDAAKALGLSR